MKSNLLLLGAFALLPQLTFGQTLETFESITATTPNIKPATFVSNGQSFTLTVDNCSNGGVFGVRIPSQVFANCVSTNSTNDANTYYGVGSSCTNGTCTGSSAQFVDNGGAPFPTANHLFGLKTTNAAAFTMKSIFIYLSSDGGTNPSAAGGVTITGKLAGNTVFTYTKTTGFATDFTTNSGFTYLDFSAGTNYTNSNIDELQFQSPNANYIALDNFTWGANVPLPLGLLSFNLKQSGDNISIYWNTSKESDVTHYEIERSADGKLFSALDKVSVNKSGNYQFNDIDPLMGDNFYRLAITSENGTVTYSDVKHAFISNSQNVRGIIYPNPTTSILFAKISGANVWSIQLTDLTGRIVISGKLSAENNSLDMARLQNGTYLYKATDATTGALVAQGKVTKI